MRAKPEREPHKPRLGPGFCLAARSFQKEPEPSRKKNTCTIENQTICDSEWSGNENLKHQLKENDL